MINNLNTDLKEALIIDDILKYVKEGQKQEVILILEKLEKFQTKTREDSYSINFGNLEEKI